MIWKNMSAMVFVKSEYPKNLAIPKMMMVAMIVTCIGKILKKYNSSIEPA